MTIVERHGQANTPENTPGHCHKCNSFADCLQAQSMSADTGTEDPHYDTENGSVYCGSCATGTYTYDSSLIPEVDSPLHCDTCGCPLECNLTPDGKEYVVEQLKEENGCTAELWREMFVDRYDLDV